MVGVARNGVPVDRRHAVGRRRLEVESGHRRRVVRRQPRPHRHPAEPVRHHWVRRLGHLHPEHAQQPAGHLPAERPEPAREPPLTGARLERGRGRRRAAVHQREARTPLHHRRVVDEGRLVEVGRRAAVVEERVLEQPQVAVAAERVHVLVVEAHHRPETSGEEGVERRRRRVRRAAHGRADVAGGGRRHRTGPRRWRPGRRGTAGAGRRHGAGDDRRVAGGRGRRRRRRRQDRLLGRRRRIGRDHRRRRRSGQLRRALRTGHAPGPGRRGGRSRRRGDLRRHVGRPQPGRLVLGRRAGADERQQARADDHRRSERGVAGPARPPRVARGSDGVALVVCARPQPHPGQCTSRSLGVSLGIVPGSRRAGEPPLCLKPSSSPPPAARSGVPTRARWSSIRPDDLSTQIVTALLEKVPAARPHRDRGPHHGLRSAGRRVGLQHRPGRRHPGGSRRRAGRDRQPLLLVEPADHPHGRPRHQGRRGRLLHRRRRRDRQPLRRRRQRHGAEPGVRRRRERTAERALGGGPVWSPPEGLPDLYIAMGQTAENVPPSTRASPARRWTSSPSCRRTAPWPASRTASSPTRSRRSRCPTAPWCRRTTAPAPARRWRGLAQLKPVFRPDGDDHGRQRLPAQRRRRRRARDERHEGRRARPHAAGPHRRLRRLRAQPRDHGRSARSRPAVRPSPGPA